MYYVPLLKEVCSTLESKKERPISFEFYVLIKSGNFDESLCEMWQNLSWGWGATMGRTPDLFVPAGNIVKMFGRLMHST